MKSDNPKYNYEAVLLIDDNRIDNFVNEKIIQSCNFARTVYSNTSAQGALEFIQNLNLLERRFIEIYPQILFIDINMPWMNGFEFIDFFKKNGAQNLLNPKLVILTSSTSKQDKLLALEASEDILFFNKPLTEELLQSLLPVIAQH